MREATPLEFGADGLLSTDARAGVLKLAAGLLEQTADHLVASATYERHDRLWPGEQELHTTNPLSLAYGACGPALLLNTVGRLPDDAVGWINDKRLDVDEYPPGLFPGLGGIAYAAGELGLADRAYEALAKLVTSPLLFEEANVMMGAAGWGMCCLHHFTRTGDADFLDWAQRAGRHITETAQQDKGTLFWPVLSEDRVNYGYGYGASGIGLFMLYLHQLTGEEQTLDVAIQALAYDLAREEVNEWGPTWRRWEQDKTIRPYWIHGAAGIGAVAIRFHEVLDDPHYRQVAESVARALFIKFTVTPGQFEGMAGIGEFLLDMYHHTGDETYRDRAIDLAETISWFAVPRREGIAWPGVSLEKLSSDYSCGAAGVGLFLQRLLFGGPRRTVDMLHSTQPDQI